MAYGPLGLKPAEFWKLTPVQFVLMQEGLLLQRKYEEQQRAKVLYLLRYPAAMAQAQSSGKQVSLIDVMHIPEFDGSIEQILKDRKKKAEEREQKDRQVYQKYKRLEGV